MVSINGGGSYKIALRSQNKDIFRMLCIVNGHKRNTSTISISSTLVNASGIMIHSIYICILHWSTYIIYNIKKHRGSNFNFVLLLTCLLSSASFGGGLVLPISNRSGGRSFAASMAAAMSCGYSSGSRCPDCSALFVSLYLRNAMTSSI